ncbi:MAG: coenzyme F420-0:L-glutamate ligase [Candidatus Hadarchaeum sp.]|uniref:coenzyme F420-0:L-glutamate ligase n=1 Tax=Candidatus Hadarchaeum sp. TaxID=2883567 RepID=UPI00317E0F36
MEVLGLSLPIIESGDDLPSMILKAADQIGGLRDGDIVVVSSKAVAAAEGRIKDLSKIRPSQRAKKIAAKSGQPPEFVELILREADRVLRIHRGVVLTIKDGIICANAGVDLSNAPKGKAILLPRYPQKSAERLRLALISGASVKVGVVISDSIVHPLRLGTVGQAIATAGIEPVIDCRGKLDIYGKPLKITYRATADQLATAAQLVMGEAGERIPVAVVREAEVELTDSPKYSPKIPLHQCLYYGSSR